MSNDYAIVPEEEFSKLRNDVNTIKDNPFGASKEGKDMISTLKELNDSMNNLVNLFTSAAEELKQEEHDSSLVSEKMDPLFSRVENLEKQNEKIAKGIVAVADMVKELKDDMKSKPRIESFQTQNNPMPQPSFETSKQPQFNIPQSAPMPNNIGMAPKPLPTSMGSAPIPMMDEEKDDKKKLFHF